MAVARASPTLLSPVWPPLLTSASGAAAHRSVWRSWLCSRELRGLRRRTSSTARMAAPLGGAAAPLPSAAAAAAAKAELSATATQLKLSLVVAVALMDGSGRVLLAQRPEGKHLAGLWEFPGGKVEAGETPEAALVRELEEELGVDVEAASLTPLSFASHPLGSGAHLLMPLWAYQRWQGQPTGREGQALAWVAPDELGSYDLPPADIPLLPVVRAAMAAAAAAGS